MQYSIDHIYEDRITIVKTRGEMSADGFLVMAEGILNCSDRPVSGNVLFDHTDLDFAGVVLEDLDKIRAYHVKNEERIGSGKSAILLAAGMKLAWDKLWDQGQKIQTANIVQIFEDRQLALKWLKQV